MNVRDGGAGNLPHLTFPSAFQAESFLCVVLVDSFRKNAGMNSYDSMRPIVIVNRSFMTGSPTEHKHFNGGITAHAMSPVVSLFKPDIRLHVPRLNLHAGKPRG